MTEETLERLRRARWGWVKIKARYSRGNSLIDDFWNLVNRSVIIGLGIGLWNQYLPWQIPMSVLPYIFIIYIPLTVAVGHLDQEVMHLTQSENEYQSDYLNPVFKKIARDIKTIKENLNGRNKKII